MLENHSSKLSWLSCEIGQRLVEAQRDPDVCKL